MDIRLAEYNDEARGKREAASEIYDNSVAFSAQLLECFDMLRRWNPSPGITLSIDAFSPSDPARCDIGLKKLRSRKREARIGMSNDLFHHRFNGAKSHLRLVRPSVKLSSPGCVTSLIITASHDYAATPRGVAPSVACLIASKCTAMKQLHISVDDNEKQDIMARRSLRRGERAPTTRSACSFLLADRRALRLDFAHAIGLLPPSITDFRLVYDYPEPRDHAFAPAEPYLLGVCGV